MSRLKVYPGGVLEYVFDFRAYIIVYQSGHIDDSGVGWQVRAISSVIEALRHNGGDVGLDCIITNMTLGEPLVNGVAALNSTWRLQCPEKLIKLLECLVLGSSSPPCSSWRT